MAEAADNTQHLAAETLFIVTIPGATPSKWVDRFTSRHRTVQLVHQDEAAQTAHLHSGDETTPVRPIPQLGYLRWRLDSDADNLLKSADIDPETVHVVRFYQEQPVICVGKDHLLAAWNPEAEGALPAAEVEQLDPSGFINPENFAPPAATDPLNTPEQPGAGERMAVEIVASGAGYTVLPASVARMFGRRDVAVLPLVPSGTHPGWQVAMAWRKELDSELIQDFIGITKGRRPSSSRSSAVPQARNVKPIKPGSAAGRSKRRRR